MSVRPFVSWSGLVRSQPRAWHAPGGEAEVASLVRAVRARGGRLRVVGAGHSFSPIARPDDVAVTLDGMDRVLALQDDRVTVEAGASLAALTAALAQRGLALPVLGSVSAQRVGGAVATGTHGSSLRWGNLGSLITGARLIDGRGEVLDLDEADPRLDAVRTHLGALGVVTRLTLRVVPAFSLAETITYVPVADAAARFRDAAERFEHAKLWWMPGMGHAMLFTYDPRPSGARSAVGLAVDRATNDWIFPPLLWLGRRVPSLLYAIHRGIQPIGWPERTRVGRSHEQFNLAMPPRHTETELAFDAADAERAFDEGVALILRSPPCVNFPFEARFVAADPGWMSPAGGRTAMQLGLYATPSAEQAALFTAFQTLGPRYGARPHWGKETHVGADALRALYPNHGRFVALAAALDPDGVFRNPFLDAVLGPPPTEA